MQYICLISGNIYQNPYFSYTQKYKFGWFNGGFGNGSSSNVDIYWNKESSGQLTSKGNGVVGVTSEKKLTSSGASDATAFANWDTATTDNDIIAWDFEVCRPTQPIRLCLYFIGWVLQPNPRADAIHIA